MTSERPKRVRKATCRMSSTVEGSYLILQFEGDGPMRWRLPAKGENDKIRAVRLKAAQYAAEHGATDGQQAAIHRALWASGYIVGRTGRPYRLSL